MWKRLYSHGTAIEGLKNEGLNDFASKLRFFSKYWESKSKNTYLRQL